MAPPLRLAQYGPEYTALLRRAHTSPPLHPLRVATPSPKHAATLRRKLYGFFGALRNDPSPEACELVAIANGIQLTLDHDHVVFTQRVTTWESQAILDALGTPTPPAVPSTVDLEGVSPEERAGLLSRLAEVRAAKNPKPS